MLNQYEDILTIFELAEILKIGNTQAYRLVRTGKIKAIKSGKDWKIPKQTVIQYICEQSKLWLLNFFSTVLFSYILKTEKKQGQNRVTGIFLEIFYRKYHPFTICFYNWTEM